MTGEPNDRGNPSRPESPEVTLAPPATAAEVASAARYGLRVAAAVDPTQWQVARSLHRMVLRSPDAGGALQLDLDPTRGALARRLRSARPDDPLGRACGLPRRATPPTVVDATAGLGRDAMVLAQLGCAVTAIERVPALAFLLHHAALAAGLQSRLEVVAADAVTWLRSAPAADVVCLDPMFDEPGRGEVKKEMQLCRALAGACDDGQALLQVARAVARERVVVKRHARAAALAPPSFAVPGERVRFDVYLTPR